MERQNRRASVVAIATKMAKEPASKAPDYVDETKLRDEIKKTEDTLRSLPIGWNCVVKPAIATLPATCGFPTVTLIQVLGWMLTAAALSFGAPFWFDLLQKFVNILGAGGKPKREDEKATA